MDTQSFSPVFPLLFSVCFYYNKKKDPLITRGFLF
nr:MAG TPA: hypothetical protein [Caudoviricetes sp.]